MPLKEYESVEVAVKTELGSLDLDDANQTRSQIAIALARTLDSANSGMSGAMAQSIPGTAKELQNVMDEIRNHISSADTFIAGLMKEE